ncbi:GlcNAc-PI de-N-acetylase [Microtetraspora sp. NBRC 13810]|uniref:PIG-L deacetylase family protein n=1 Tax=Microtetraspora sp. NBRC 13810 TaxID=3030990 RepID=UPI0024A00964|nr:PIG-L deacetylase family protein [Microtetraspora sp. NBRC 13810]GLW05515.1 GlcNAc-PI de-N-acetylase [Microtetraspora sp. NBRC 13810]
MLEDNEVNRVLVVTAHPDDVDFGAAGTIASLTGRGVEVSYCLVTAGDAGGFDRELDNGGMSELRRAEQTAAAKAVGVSDVRFLGYADGLVEQSLGLRRDITRVIRQVRPDLVITHSPERNYAVVFPSHPDHRAVGGSTLDAVYPDARNPYTFPELLTDEGLDAWTVREVWLTGGPSPDHYVDITATLEHKIAALRAHVSQVAHRDDLDAFVRARFGETARLGGLGEGRYAEAFQRVVTG